MSNLLIERGGRTVGPFTPEEVRRYMAKGSVAPQTAAWTEGLLDWAPLEQVLPRAESQTGDGPPEFTDTAGRNIVPDEVRGFSWGAFLCGPLWGFPYRVWVSIFSWVPGIGALMWLWLGFNGRELAWGARDWESPQAFLQSERRWTQIGWVLFLVATGLQIAASVYLFQQRGAMKAVPGGTPQVEEEATEPERVQPAAPRAQPKPAQGERGQPSERRQPSAGGATAPMARVLWQNLLMGMEVAGVRQLLGAPVHTEKVAGKNVDVWIYRRVSYEDDPAELDAFMLIGMQGGKVAGIEFVKKEGK